VETTCSSQAVQGFGRVTDGYGTYAMSVRRLSHALWCLICCLFAVGCPLGDPVRTTSQLVRLRVVDSATGTYVVYADVSLKSNLTPLIRCPRKRLLTGCSKRRKRSSHRRSRASTIARFGSKASGFVAPPTRMVRPSSRSSTLCSIGPGGISRRPGEMR
jgi:hypothetical protein